MGTVVPFGSGGEEGSVHGQGEGVGVGDAAVMSGAGAGVYRGYENGNVHANPNPRRNSAGVVGPGGFSNNNMAAMAAATTASGYNSNTNHTHR